jgi:hypothetical protein
MSRKVVVLDYARGDIEDGRDFYDSCEYGVGDYFSGCILTDIASLQIYFGLHRRHHGYHRLLSKRFPYSIYYDVINEVVIILAVLDMRMEPSNLREIVSRRRTKNG